MKGKSMSYDKDWEVHLALEDPNDPIHDYIANQLEEESVDECADSILIERKKPE